MFIQTEGTPNPATLKFLPGCQVMTTGTAQFNASDDVAASPLAQRLFESDGVEGVFFGADFITITKGDAGNWETMKPLLLGAIMEHFTAERPVMVEGAAAEVEEVDDDPVIAQIKELIETRVRPAVAQDGGDIIFRSFEDGIVTLKMQGACAGCPSSAMTLKSGIENMLKHYVPEVQEVREGE